MPYINCITNIKVANSDILKSELAKALDSIADKGEKWLMVSVQSEEQLYFQGNDKPAAFIELKYIGSFSSEVKIELTEAFGKIFEKEENIDSNRVYIKFTGVKAEDWGWNGSLFG